MKIEIFGKTIRISKRLIAKYSQVECNGNPIPATDFMFSALTSGADENSSKRVLKKAIERGMRQYLATI